MSQILANEPSIKKVFFLVDRKDLDSQTIKEFNKFEPDSVDTTDKTEKLVQQIRDINRPLIVTTIQKMSNAIKSPRYEKIMEQYRDDKVIFIIDECHRSIYGKWQSVLNYFKDAKILDSQERHVLKRTRVKMGVSQPIYLKNVCIPI